MLLRSSFLRAIAILSSGQILASIIPFLIAPVLGRIYHPEDYGLLASYTAIANVAASVATLHYQHGVLTEKTEQRAHQMALLSLLATLGVAAVIVPVAVGVFFLDPFESATHGHRLWFLMLPVSTVVSGASLAAIAVANRARAYRRLAVMQISAAAASALGSLAFGLAGMRSDALLLAYVMSQAVSLGFSISIATRHQVWRHRASTRKIFSLAYKHRGYPMFTMPGALVQSIGLQLPIFTLTYLGEASLLGSFSRAQSLLILPISLLSGAIGRVYFQRATEDYNRTGNCRPIFLKAMPLIFVLAFPFLVLFGVFGPSVITLYLGDNWKEAGQVAQILAPVFFLQMFVGPLGGSTLFAGNQRLSLIVHVFGIVLVLIGCGIPMLVGTQPTGVIIGWAVAVGFFYVIQTGLGWELSAKQNRWASSVKPNHGPRSRNTTRDRLDV
jgi:O-antigen/teichoic acid export membrane protein